MALLNTLIPNFNRAPARAGTDSSRPGVRPFYEVKETDEAWGVTVQLPGVSKEGLSITDENGVISIQGERAWKQPSGWTTLYRESGDLPYQLQLRHDNVIDADKAVAELKDGVLRLSLPKAESRKPRKIAIA
jgi:HSP20 family protein